MKKLFSLLTMLALLLAVSPSFAAPPDGKGGGNGGGKGGGGGDDGGGDTPTLGYRYEITYSTLWGVDYYLRSGMNDHGDVVTTPNWVVDENGNNRPVDPVLYRFSDNTEYSINNLIQADFDAGLLDVDSALIDPDTNRPFPMAYAAKTNNHGQIAGAYNPVADDFLGCLYTPATVDADGNPVPGSYRDLIPAELLDPSGINQISIYGLNDDGDVVCKMSGDGGGTFVYLSAGGPVATPTLLNADDMAAAAPTANQFISETLNNRDIQANGDVTLQFGGNFVGVTNEDVRYDYNLSTGAGVVVSTGLANPDAIARYMKGMNNLGDVVGREYDGSRILSGFNAYVYLDGAAQAFDPTGGDEGRASDINDLGVVVGGVNVTYTYKKPRRTVTKREPFVYIDGTTYPIRSLIDGEEAFDRIYPSHNNNQGQILARAYDADGNQYILLLTPYTP